MGARREITAAVVDRYRSAGRMDKGRILDELCAVTGWHRKHAIRALASHVGISPEARRQRSPTYGLLSGMLWWRCGKPQIESAASVSR